MTPDPRDPRDRNNEQAFAAVRAWCDVKRVDPEPILDRLALALLTESSGGFIFANDGAAYAPGKFPSPIAALPPALRESARQRAYDTLRRSLDLPHDRVGRDGRSTGPLQQISRDAVKAVDPAASWGWGSLAETMNPATSALMFVKSLHVTANRFYSPTLGVSVDCGDPIVADVLRTQRPAMGDTLPHNYRPTQVVLAKAIARGGPRFFTNGGMP